MEMAKKIIFIICRKYLFRNINDLSEASVVAEYEEL